MLRNRTNRACLDAFYNIQPGNGAGQFFQPRSPHRADSFEMIVCSIPNGTAIWQDAGNH